MGMSAYDVRPRWKEELVITSPEGALVIEMTMGVANVYFPTESEWEKQAPTWAMNRRPEILAAVTNWCSREQVPLSLGGWIGTANSTSP